MRRLLASILERLGERCFALAMRFGGAGACNDEFDAVPPQEPLTPQARAMMWQPPSPPPLSQPEPPLTGSVHARMQSARGSR